MGVDGSDDVAERLTALILAACSEVAGPALASSVLALPKERVRASPRATAGGCDFQCHAPVTVFRKLEAVTRRDAVDADTADTSSTPSISSSPDEPGTMRASRRPDGAIEVVVVSSFGVARHRTYADATRLEPCAALPAAWPPANDASGGGAGIQLHLSSIRSSPNSFTRATPTTTTAPRRLLRAPPAVAVAAVTAAAAVLLTSGCSGALWHQWSRGGRGRADDDAPQPTISNAPAGRTIGQRGGRR